MTDRHGVVVGIDGTHASQDAVAWALAHTDQLGPVRPVYVWDYPLMATAGTPFGYAGIPPTQEMQDSAERAARDFVASLEGVEGEAVTVQGDPGVNLCREAATANALVVGTRERGPVRANVLGSVGRYCADHTPVALIIVPQLSDPHRDATSASLQATRIAVGVDGSDASYDALLWAGRTFPDAEITVVTAWQTPIDAPVLFGGDRFDITQFRAHARGLVNEVADKACAELGWDGDRIERRIAEGDPRWVLVAAQEDADLMVVGQRGRSGLKHLVLGSTTTSLIHQPHCPIVVVPTDEIGGPESCP